MSFLWAANKLWLTICAHGLIFLFAHWTFSEVATAPDSATPIVPAPEVQDSAPSPQNQSPPREGNAEAAPPTEGGVTMEDGVSTPPPPSPEPARQNIYELNDEDIANMNPFQSKCIRPDNYPI